MANIVTILDTHQLWETRAILNSNYAALNAELAEKVASPGTADGALKYLRRNAANTGWELAFVSGGGSGDVAGAANLSHPGRITMVSAAGTITESSLSEISGRILLGAVDNGVDTLQVGGSVQATSFKGSLDWAYIQNKPASYAPTSHAHTGSDITGLAADLAAKIASPDLTAAGGKYLRRNAGNDAWELATVPSLVLLGSAPSYSGSLGDVVFNAAPIAGGHMGWVCLGGTTWKRWGVIDL